MEENTKNMLAGKPYNPCSKELLAWQQQAHQLNNRYNQTSEKDAKERATIIDQLLPNHAKHVAFAGPIHFDYGRFTTISEGTFANFNLTVLDSCPVTIGARCMLGPNLTLATAKHPLLADQRNPHVGPDGQIQMAAYAAPDYYRRQRLVWGKRHRATRSDHWRQRGHRCWGRRFARYYR